MMRILVIFLISIALTACGGGGGGGGGSPSYLNSTSGPTLTAANYPANWTTIGTVTPPSVSPVVQTYSDGTSAITEDGSLSKPFQQVDLSAKSITDPNSYVSSSTTTYNLGWGVPDKSGPGYANLYPSASTHLGSNLSYAGITVSGQGVVGPTLLQPSADVMSAWNAGWTGKGVNVLLIDTYANKATCTSANGNCHGVMTMMNVNLIAPGANEFGLDYNFASSAFDNTGANLTSSKSINVTNLSWSYIYSANNWNCDNGCGVAPTNAVYNAGIASTAAANNNLINILNGVTNVSNITNLGNSVITQAAGNDKLDTKYNLTALALSGNAAIQSRLLVVGALNQNGSVASPATIASYSNYAGSNTAISDRFVVAYGNMPWNSGSVAVNGSNMGVTQGTSFAAPLVAGYAAIVSQKFPNLTAANTSNIILDTARYDTLSCNPSCDPTIYGKGEASLSRALAPVGRLR